VTGGSANNWTLAQVDITHGLPVQPMTGATWAVTGTFWQATQPVSVASLPLPTGAATAANQATEISGLSAIISLLSDTLTVQGAVAVTGTFWQATQPVSGTITANAGTNLNTSALALESGGNLATLAGAVSSSKVQVNVTNSTLAATQSGAWNITNISGTVSLPTGAATAAKQPALGTAGSASADVITVQGAASMTPLLVTASIAADQTLATVTTVSTVTAVTAITNALPAGTNLLGKVGIDQTTNGTTNGIVDKPCTSGGLSIYTNFETSNAVIAANIKGSAGQVYSVEFFNINATPVFVRLYNTTDSPPTTSDTPVWRGIIPGNTAGAGFVKAWPQGLAFSTGIGIRITNAIADNDATALTANTVVANVEYA
jgi:hypothetical protein